MKLKMVPTLAIVCFLVSIWVVGQQYYRNASLKVQFASAEAELKQVNQQYDKMKKPGTPSLEHHEDN